MHRVIQEDEPSDKIKEVLEGIISRLHIIVVGPGLGREDYMQNAARTAIGLARQNNQYIVIDADGLFLVGNDPSVIKGYRRAVLTPNVVEFARLCEKMVSEGTRAWWGIWSAGTQSLQCPSVSSLLQAILRDSSKFAWSILPPQSFLPL